jgi:16S rRNA (cytosine1402-N4)-methyltransferase
MTGQSDYHIPVLSREVRDALCKRKNGCYVDATLGGGGHFRALAAELSAEATLIGIDRDPDAVVWNRRHPATTAATVVLEHARFSEVAAICRNHAITSVDGVLLDLGVSSFQIDQPERGFSFMQECSLDMRMNAQEGERATDLITRLSVDDLAHVLATYGEVRNAGRMARVIKNGAGSITTSAGLRECLAREYGVQLKYKVLAKVFMALRIAVNDELGELRRFLAAMPELLANGGRIAVISYHSLEDRIVKEFFRENEPHCICPKAALRCTCGTPGRLKRISRKAISAAEDEIVVNPRARSARLRIAEKIPGGTL